MMSAILLLTSCQDSFIDSFIDLAQKVDELKETDKAIMDMIETYNESIEALQAIINVLEVGEFIEKVTPIMDQTGTKILGYTLTFTEHDGLKRDPITIYNGVDGKNGAQPQISAAKGPDGKYYWTMDGEWVLDASGNKISVIDGLCPRLDVKDGYWYVSYDQGSTWTQIGKATGEDGRDGTDARLPVTIPAGGNTEEGITFLLPDGTSFYIQKRRKVELVMDLPKDLVAGIGGGETIVIPYTIKNADANTFISVSTDGNYATSFTQGPVDKNNSSKGEILITSPRSYTEGFVNVMVFNSTGVVVMEVIHFYEHIITVDREFTVSGDGGTIKIPFELNFDYTVSVDKSSSSWLSIVATKAPATIKGTIQAKAAKNSGVARSGIIYVYPTNSRQPFASIVVTQSSSMCTVEKASFVLGADGGTVSTPVQTTYGVSLKVPSSAQSWIKPTVGTGAVADSYVALLSVEPNNAETERSATVGLYSKDGKTLLANLQVVQSGRTVDIDYSMALTVRVNYSNDFTVFIPIDVTSETDCYVDWGDGSGVRIISGKYVGSTVSHRYNGLSTGRTFQVVISGKVTSLSSAATPDGYSTSIESIDRWGNLGIVKMESAFKGYTKLKTLPLDEFGAFATITSFKNAFNGCSGLTDISAHLFDHAAKVESFEGAFYGCSSLIVLGEDMFAHCPEVTSFKNTFANCSSLQSIPAGIFAHNEKAIDFSSCFSNCTMLSSIPAKIFSACKEVSSFNATFQSCTALTAIPASLFDSAKRVLDFRNTFKGCKALTGESPYTTAGGKKVHLYEREANSDYFVPPIYQAGCFNGCTALSDEKNIPTTWK